MPVPVVTIKEMRQWEKATWEAGQTEQAVIEAVGRQVARRILELTVDNDHIVILAGKGNNGSDARASAQHLNNRSVQLLNVTSPRECFQAVEEALLKNPAVVVDGLFGIGLNRPLSEDWERIIRTVNLLSDRTISLDVPSGLDADTGLTLGECIKAELTLTIGGMKMGLLTTTASVFTGRVEVLSDVGFVPCPVRTEVLWTESSDFLRFPGRRSIASHKGDFGHLGIVAGSLGYHGAAVLAATAAQRAHPGLITLYTSERCYLAVASQLQSVMVSPLAEGTNLGGLEERATAMLAGPGLAGSELSEQLKQQIRNSWETCPLPVVVDASALDWIGGGPLREGLLRVVTPHPGEAARILNTTSKTVQSNRVLAVREMSKKLGGCWVVLKGHQTLIGRQSGEVFVNSSGTPHLAQGGSGDTLAGFIGGLLAQPELQRAPSMVLRYAVWEHGHAAERLDGKASNWTVENLVEELGRTSSTRRHEIARATST